MYPGIPAFLYRPKLSQGKCHGKETIRFLFLPLNIMGYKSHSVPVWPMKTQIQSNCPFSQHIRHGRYFWLESYKIWQCFNTKKLCFHASLKAANNIFKEKKPHTIVKPRVLENSQKTSSLNQRRNIETGSLSCRGISSRITSTSLIISFTHLMKVMEELAYKSFPLKTVTDIFQCIQLLVFDCSVHIDTRELQFCESLLEPQRPLTSSKLLKVPSPNTRLTWTQNLVTVL